MGSTCARSDTTEPWNAVSVHLYKILLPVLAHLPVPNGALRSIPRICDWCPRSSTQRPETSLEKLRFGEPQWGRASTTGPNRKHACIKHSGKWSLEKVFLDLVNPKNFKTFWLSRSFGWIFAGFCGLFVGNLRFLWVFISLSVVCVSLCGCLRQKVIKQRKPLNISSSWNLQVFSIGRQLKKPLWYPIVTTSPQRIMKQILQWPSASSSDPPDLAPYEQNRWLNEIEWKKQWQ